MTSSGADTWHFAADTGGTFTDLVGRDAAGSVRRAKVLSSGVLRFRARVDGDGLRVEGTSFPDGFLDGCPVRGTGEDGTPAGTVASSREGHLAVAWESAPPAGCATVFEVDPGLAAPVVGAHLLTGTPLRERLPPHTFRLATTRGTNALLERKGRRVLLVTNRGFGDTLRIGDQRRPSLFARPIIKRGLLPHEVVEVDLRVDAAGARLAELDEARFRSEVAEVAGRCPVAAVCLLHAFRHPEDEERVARLLGEMGLASVVCSHRVAARPGFLVRMETTLAEASLHPVLDDYLGGVAQAGADAIEVMRSTGGMVPRERFHARDSLLSGPAGGVVGASRAARAAGELRILAFDMGGTSTDASRFDGDFIFQREHQVGDVRIQSPALRIETVAAGGGSICRFNGFAYEVGPESAGADPGPACYGRGGPLTLTDVHLLLDRIPEDGFHIPISRGAAERAFESLLDEAGEGGADGDRRRAVLEGLLEIANERMAEALRRISIREGVDPAGYALVSFGGAGGLHACAIARRLGIQRIIQPASAGILSAEGLMGARPERICERPILKPLAAVAEDLASLFHEAESSEEAFATAAEARREVFVRLMGQEMSLPVPWEPGAPVDQCFHDAFEGIFGFRQEGVALEVLGIRSVLRLPEEEPAEEVFPGAEAGAGRLVGSPLRAEGLKPGQGGAGPVVIVQSFGTLAVEAGWCFEVGTCGSLRLGATGGEGEGAPRPVEVEHAVYLSRFEGIVEAMGETVRRTSLSTNIRERLDFSCALLDAEGRLAVNAPHVPVHLGALGDCVRRLRGRFDWKGGDVVVTNHPGAGGSHLPDVTVVAAVFGPGAVADPPAGFVAVRAHHAEIGGSSPGSLPTGARTLAEEGVVIAPFKLCEGGEFRRERVRHLLTGAPYPSRAVEQNLADLASQCAALRTGRELAERLIASGGRERWDRFLGRIIDQSATWMAEAIKTLGFSGTREGEATLDHGGRIRVALSGTERLRIDFSGTSAVDPGSFNAPEGVTRSAVLYVLRLLLGREVPLNEGLRCPVDVVVPAGCCLNPVFDRDGPGALPAVGAGNIELSQRVVEVLIRALRLEADSQGTMNNVIFGDEAFSHYETIGGGSGASALGPGADGVHCHMTNTAITDAEILEIRFPVRIERFAIRAGSGGPGRHRGGHGLVREYRFLRPLEVSLLTQHRRDGPRGLDGGGDGAPGRQVLVRDGREMALDAVAGFTAGAGDLLRVETPGGGGWG